MYGQVYIYYVYVYAWTSVCTVEMMIVVLCGFVDSVLHKHLTI